MEQFSSNRQTKNSAEILSREVRVFNVILIGGTSTNHPKSVEVVYTQ